MDNNLISTCKLEILNDTAFYVCPNTTKPKPINGNVPIKPEFVNTGSVRATNTGNTFVDLAYSIPFLTSDADTYITSLVSKKLVSGFEPTFFQIPYIYSCADNLIRGNYTSSYVEDKNIVITTYKIPYTGELKEETATFVVYFDKTNNILFNEIPREFSYNSVDQASIAFSELADKSFQGIFIIPSSFVSNIDDMDYKLKFNISSSDVITATPFLSTSTNTATLNGNPTRTINTTGSSTTKNSDLQITPEISTTCNPYGYITVKNCSDTITTNCNKDYGTYTLFNGNPPAGCCVGSQGVFKQSNGKGWWSCEDLK